MSESDFRRPAIAPGAWPHGTQPYQGRHHADEVEDHWYAEPEYGVVYESPDADADPPDGDGGRFWPDDPSSTAPYAVPAHDQGPAYHQEPAYHQGPVYDQGRRFPVRLIVTAAVAMAAVAAITAFVIPRNGAIRLSPAANPSAGTGQQGSTASTGTGTGTAAAPSPAASAPAITKTEAERILSHWSRVNNQANEQRSDALLGTIEAGSSFRLDIGAYRFERASNPSAAGYVPFAPVRAAYYIPRQPANGAWPRWFVASVTYAALASPQHATGTGYLLFTQAGPGAAWKEVLEPYTLPASGPAPFIATDAQGYAAAVSPAANNGLAIAPGQVVQATAASLDGTGLPALAVPANLADVRDKAFWRARLPATATVTDRHLTAPGPVFGLRTVSGGALLFYSMTAQLTLAPPPGETFRLNIPGYFSPSQALTSARIGYIDQFAAYDPPAGQGAVRIAADASSIAARG
jgi:hypothetical protein